jgi:hypothetical protein
MAKGQLRSNREAKKPKKERPKVAPAAGSSALSTLDLHTLEKTQSKYSLGKRK